MKKILLSAIIAMFMPAVFANAAEDGHVYVIPIGADGSAHMLADGSYEGQVELTAHEGYPGIMVRKFSVENGFIFDTVNEDSSKQTFYTLRTPPVSFDSKNLLSITATTADYIRVPAGRYDITFYRSTGEGHSFTITRASTGIDEVDADSAPAVYYDLSGRRVDSSPEPGLYIARSGSEVRKVMVR